jgi:hypothetical protein
MARSREWIGGILGCVLVVSGCDASSDNLPREAVSGSVTLECQPLAKGTIQFAPISDKLTTTATGGINDGKYSIPRGEGLVPGTYKVAISSLEVSSEMKLVHGAPGKIGPPAKNLISKQFNTNSKLTAEVKGGGTNTFDFELTKKDNKEDLEPTGARSRDGGRGPRR